MKQLHKKFTYCHVKDLMERYLKKKVEREVLQKVLGIKKTRFFDLKRLKEDPENFSVSYFRSIPTRTISKAIEINIIKYKLTDEVEPQWKQALDDYGVKVNYALSPRAKRKIKKPLVLNSFIQKYNQSMDSSYY